MKKILMIGTGGTIASQISQDGLRPALSSEQLLSFVPKVSEFCKVDCMQLFSLDSTNIRPENWVALARTVQEHYERYDGFVISHGTDTMAYTAAALSYLIQGAKKPVVLTGAQKPISFDSTDSKVNLTDAFLCAASDHLHGVMIVLPRVSSEMACWMRCSFSGSTLAVASSRMIMDASLRIARAMDAP